MQVNLSDSEWKLMNRLWEQSPRTIMELTASLKQQRRRASSPGSTAAAWA